MGGLSLGLILNSPCLHHENCLADKKENFYWHLGNERVRYTHSNQSIRKRNLTFLSIIKRKTTGHKFIHCWRRHDISTKFYSPLTGAQMEDVRGSWWRRDSSPSGEGGNKFSIFPLVCFRYAFSTSSSKNSDEFSSFHLTFFLSFRMSPFFSNTQVRSKHWARYDLKVVAIIFQCCELDCKLVDEV